VLAKTNEIAIKQILLNRDVIQKVLNGEIVFIAACLATIAPAWQDFS
jgi:hypothetical protein